MFKEIAINLIAWTYYKIVNPIPWHITWLVSNNENINTKVKIRKCYKKLAKIKPPFISIVYENPDLSKKISNYFNKIYGKLPNTRFFLTFNSLALPHHIHSNNRFPDTTNIVVKDLQEILNYSLVSRILEYESQIKKVKHSYEISLSIIITSEPYKNYEFFISRVLEEAPNIYLLVYLSEKNCKNEDKINRLTQLINDYQEKGAKTFLMGSSFVDLNKTKIPTFSSNFGNDYFDFIIKEKFLCHQEKFSVFMLPDASLYTCRSYSGISALRQRLNKYFEEKRYRACIRTYVEFWRTKVFGKSNFNCAHYTNCPLWIEKIVSQKLNEHPEELSFIQNRLTPKSILTSVKFIRDKINPHFTEELLSSDLHYKKNTLKE